MHGARDTVITDPKDPRSSSEVVGHLFYLKGRCAIHDKGAKLGTAKFIKT